MEFLSTLAIVSLVMVYGVPRFIETIKNAEIIAQANNTLGLIAYSRSEAAKRPGTTITVCASKTTTNSTPTCSQTNKWEEGWVVFSDVNNNQVIDTHVEDVNGNGILDIGEDVNSNGTLDTVNDELLRVGEPLEDNTILASGFTNSGTGFITFDSNGIPDSAGTFVVCDDRGNLHARGIVLSIIGHARVATDDDTPGDDIINDHTGVNVTCP